MLHNLAFESVNGFVCSAAGLVSGNVANTVATKIAVISSNITAKQANCINDVGKNKIEKNPKNK